MLYSPEEQVTVRMSQGLVRYLREEGILSSSWKYCKYITKKVSTHVGRPVSDIGQILSPNRNIYEYDILLSF
jgi:hypothetical protein